MHVLRALISIHDVEPRRFDRTLDVVNLIESMGLPPTTLLVVPGAEWTPSELGALRTLSSRGWELAGHGWSHRAPEARTLRHRLHSTVLSRDQGEHLGRPREELRRLVVRCFRWFETVDLPRPELYVPPAWALGRLRPKDLRALPFSCYETLGGYLDRTGRYRAPVPLVGFEADTTGREIGLKVWNRANLGLAAITGLPVRIAIHPDDLHLRLRHDLRAIIGDNLRVVKRADCLLSWYRCGATASCPAPLDPLRITRRAASRR